MYSTLDDMKKLLPEEMIVQLSDDEEIGVINQDRVDEVIASADSEIDSYCGGRYTVPFAVVHPILKKISVDIAIYNLYSRKLEDIPETREGRYKNAIRQLELISKGQISIGVDPSPPASTNTVSSVQISGSDRTFSKDTLSDY